MRYSYRSFDFRLNLGTQTIFNMVFRVVNDFFSFRALCPTCALFMSNILYFYRTFCLRYCDIRRFAHITNSVLRFFISSSYNTKESKHTLWKRSRNSSHALNFLKNAFKHSGFQKLCHIFLLPILQVKF